MVWERMVGAALAAVMIGASPVLAAPQHPLDGLQAEEIEAVKSILTEAGRLEETARFPLIERIMPEKADVLRWSEGDPIPRRARALVKDGPETHEALIDLEAGSLLDWTPAAGEGMVLFEEFIGAMELALGHPDFQAGLSERGLTPDDVFCLPLTAGNFFEGEDAGKRLMKVPCYQNPTGSNFYAKPIEGLLAVVDLGASEVLEVIDTGAIPLPEDPWGYTEDEIEARYGLRPETSPATLSQPGGPNVVIDGGKVAWDMWQFHVSVEKRAGVVLSLIEAEDQGKWRSILYQAHLSEVFVPYMDPDVGWYWRTYMDSGEYGFGLFLSPLRAGVDCPDYAAMLPAMIHDDNGNPFEIPDAICIFERSPGDPSWRHFEIFAQSEEVFTPTEGRPWTELVVRSASEVGNYDYLIDYVFRVDGSIEIAVGSTGLDAVKGVASQSMADETAADDTAYGTLIAPHLAAPNHDHYFNFRLDFDIDGQENNFMRTGIVPGPVGDDAKRRSFWVTEMEMPSTEAEAVYRVNPETPAMYHVGNMNVESGLGHKPTYMINSGNSVAYAPFDPADPPVARNDYVLNTFHVTPYDAEQRYAGGAYAMASDGSDTLGNWVKAGRSIDNTDLVVWYTMGFHHIPRMEDWPVMPLMWKRMKLAPFNFFSHNPAMTQRLPKTDG
jgi:primary-amine oxidase